MTCAQDVILVWVGVIAHLGDLLRWATIEVSPKSTWNTGDAAAGHGLVTVQRYCKPILEQTFLDQSYAAVT